MELMPTNVRPNWHSAQGSGAVATNNGSKGHPVAAPKIANVPGVSNDQLRGLQSAEEPANHLGEVVGASVHAMPAPPIVGGEVLACPQAWRALSNATALPDWAGSRPFVDLASIRTNSVATAKPPPWLNFSATNSPLDDHQR
jgi:hypothetical protein